jgi:hypothetical protein
MTPVKPQISKLQADKILPFLPSWLQRVMAALLVSVCQASQVVRAFAYYLFL